MTEPQKRALAALEEGGDWGLSSVELGRAMADPARAVPLSAQAAGLVGGRMANRLVGLGWARKLLAGGFVVTPEGKAEGRKEH